MSAISLVVLSVIETMTVGLIVHLAGNGDVKLAYFIGLLLILVCYYEGRFIADRKA